MKLSSKSRNALPSSSFGLPGSRKFPMPNASHAANAKARATQQVEAGNLSPSSKAKIDAKANKVMGVSKAPAVAKTPSVAKVNGNMEAGHSAMFRKAFGG